MTERESTDEALITQAAHGTDAFEQLVFRYYGMVYALAYARLRDREASQEAAQEVFLRAYLKLPNLP